MPWRVVPPASHRVSRVPWYSGYRPSASCFAYRAITCCGLPFQVVQLQSAEFRRSTTPHMLPYTVWALPGSLAATSGISIDYFSSGYLDVSVPPVPFPCGILEHDLKWVAPFGDLRINACLRLPEAYRSFLRPSSALSA